MFERVSLWGMYKYDNTVLDTLNLPEDLAEKADDIKNSILINSAELELYYTDLDFLKKAIDVWSKKQLPVWEKIMYALDQEFSPIENYDRYETTTDNRDISNRKTGSNTASGTVTGSGNSSNSIMATTTNSGTSTNEKNSYDGSATTPPTLVTDNKDTISNTETVSNSSTGSNTSSTTTSSTASETESTVTDDDLTRTSHIHGNIGVVESTTMIKNYIALYGSTNIHDIIVNDFIKEFCLRVY